MNSLPKLALHGRVDGAQRTYRLRPGLNRIGRLRRSQIVLRAEGVSRHHALIHLRADGASIEDLASKNGCFVNDQPVLRHPLKIGDRIRIGTIELELQEAESKGSKLAIELAEADAAESTYRTDSTQPANAADSAGPDEAIMGLDTPPGYCPGRSAPMRHLHWLAARLAPSDLPILIVGETGVGKEAVARSLHLTSGRPGEFLAVNCAAIPGDLLEAELFGIGSRVATGVAGRAGLLAEAAGGTLLLDEVGEMPERLQSKLLRALQEQEIKPLGGATVTTDVRMVAATHSMTPFRGLRPDLYYRLAGGLLEVPPLRERREDIPVLVEHFLDRAVQQAGPRVRGLTAGALQALVQRDWPGNVRELEHEVLRLVQLAADSEVLTESMVQTARIAPATGSESSAEPFEPGGPNSDGTLDLDTLERRAIEVALRRANGNRTAAAQLLGISRHSLRRRLIRHSLSEDELT